MVSSVLLIIVIIIQYDKFDLNTDNGYNLGMVKVSIIIPVHNTEKFLGQCLDSITSQSLPEIQIICINDGSNENCAKLLDRYALLDSRIEIITKEHKGQSCARNAGIKRACGEYILFVDSDDYISSIAVEQLYDAIECQNVDVLVFDYVQGDLGYNNYSLMLNDLIVQKLKNELFNIKTLDADYYKYFPVSVWSKIYRTDFIKNNNIYFPEGICYEDVPYWANIFLKAESVAYIPKPFYYYNNKNTSSVMTIKNQVNFDVFRAYELVLEHFKNSEFWGKYKNTINLLMIMDFLKKFEKISDEFRFEYYKKLKEFAVEIDYSLYENDNYFDFEKNYIKSSLQIISSFTLYK